ncbi:MAG: hypothetical protein V6Z86_00965 [Hyphomicrobiales bacterium]
MILTRRFHCSLAVTACLGLGSALAGCGFHPVYETREDGSSLARTLADVAVEQQDDRTGQRVRNALLSIIAPVSMAGKPRYTLNLETKSKNETLIVNEDTMIARQAYRLTATFALIEFQTGRTVYFGRAVSRVSYDRVGSEFANIQSGVNAEEQAAREIAQDIALQITGYLASAKALR